MPWKICDICENFFSEPNQLSETDVLCDSCKKIVDLNKKKKDFNATAVKNALKAAVYIDKDSKEFICFKCFYTEIPCNINLGSKDNSSSLKNAFDLTFDHKNPIDGNKGKDLVVCLNIINKMKSNIPSNKFKELIKVLAKYLEGNIDPKTLENEIKRIL